MTPLSPKVLSGAIVSYRLPDPVPSVILFQYNPASLQRSMEIRAAGGTLESPPRDEPYGRVAVWRDPWGNRWDLIRFARPDRAGTDASQTR